MIRLTVLCFLVCVLTACGKDSTAEYDDARNQILGTWQLSESTETEDIGQLGSLISNRSGSITFSDNGTGINTLNFSEGRPFEWIYQLSPEKISIVTKSDSTSQGFLVFGKTHLFDVIENRSTVQQWIENDNALFLIDDITKLAARETRWELIPQ